MAFEPHSLFKPKKRQFNSFIVRMDKYTIYNLLKLLCLAFYI